MLESRVSSSERSAATSASELSKARSTSGVEYGSAAIVHTCRAGCCASSVDVATFMPSRSTSTSASSAAIDLPAAASVSARTSCATPGGNRNRDEPTVATVIAKAADASAVNASSVAESTHSPTASTTTRVRFPAVRRGQVTGTLGLIDAAHAAASRAETSSAASRSKRATATAIRRSASNSAGPTERERIAARSDARVAACSASASPGCSSTIATSSNGAAASNSVERATLPITALRSGDAGARSSASASGPESVATAMSVDSCWSARSTAAAAAGVAAAARGHLRDGDDQLRARVAGRERNHLLGHRQRGRGVTRRQQRFGKRLPRREKRGVEARRLPPRCERLGQPAQLPQHLAQHEVRVGRARIGSARPAKAQHRVDRAPFPLVRAPARNPIGAFRRRAHGRSSAFFTRAHSNGRPAVVGALDATALS